MGRTSYTENGTISTSIQNNILWSNSVSIEHCFIIANVFMK